MIYFNLLTFLMSLALMLFSYRVFNGLFSPINIFILLTAISISIFVSIRSLKKYEKMGFLISGERVVFRYPENVSIHFGSDKICFSAYREPVIGVRFNYWANSKTRISFNSNSALVCILDSDKRFERINVDGDTAQFLYGKPFSLSVAQELMSLIKYDCGIVSRYHQSNP